MRHLIHEGMSCRESLELELYEEVTLLAVVRDLRGSADVWKAVKSTITAMSSTLDSNGTER